MVRLNEDRYGIVTKKSRVCESNETFICTVIITIEPSVGTFSSRTRKDRHGRRESSQMHLNSSTSADLCPLSCALCWSLSRNPSTVMQQAQKDWEYRDREKGIRDLDPRSRSFDCCLRASFLRELYRRYIFLSLFLSLSLSLSLFLSFGPGWEDCNPEMQLERIRRWGRIPGRNTFQSFASWNISNDVGIERERERREINLLVSKGLFNSGLSSVVGGESSFSSSSRIVFSLGQCQLENGTRLYG